MSDYEGDWEPVKSQVNAYPPKYPPEPTHNYIVPKGTSFLQAQEAARQKPRRPRHAPAVALPPTYRPGLQSLLSKPAFHQNGHHAPPQSAPKEQVQLRVLKLDAYKKWVEHRDAPDAEYEMMHSIKTVAKNLPKHNYLSPAEIVKDELARICLSTNAFIAVPPEDDHVLRIWGTPEQVEKARAHLLSWEMHVKRPGKGDAKAKAWTKQNALDGREEDRLLRKNIQEHQHEIFQHFASDTVFPFEAYLVWPDGYDLQNFIDDYDSSVLIDMSHKFGCAISHEKHGLRATKVASENQHAVFLVYARLVGLVKEMVARRKRGIRTVQCQLPSFDECLQFVAVRPNTTYNMDIHVPELAGPFLPPTEAEKWSQLSSTTNKKYRTATKTALQSCIKSLHVSQKHVRMRVNFGQIALSTYRRSTNDRDFEIEEFITMLQNPMVKTSQCPLLVEASFDFIDALNTLDVLGEPEYAWAVQFDFGGGQAEQLRLEREFSYNPIDPDEPSVSATRWLKSSADTTQDVTDLLELNHLDLKKIGYQFHIGAATIYSNQKVSQSLRSFAGNVAFKPSLNGLRFAPSKHAVFPLGNRELETVREEAVAKYRFKDTKGTLEVKRVDIFSQQFGEPSPVPQRTEWHANYYYQEWDNLMAQFANIEAGQDVDFTRDILTFFPKVVDEDYPKSLPQGFKNFMKEVEEIQLLLSQALGEHAGKKAKVAEREPEMTNGVNGH
ncbi:hypothetical protein PMZ80_008522 [Knufia obscura]|uniref:DUF7905 domain-containing protein n=1 Tax=Knufia obscura TaxID=1635080 RepID=A0ABR0RGF5_9EURO|nr:hypothetical protein PMZ80_008522 [Knufia obscura]